MTVLLHGSRDRGRLRAAGFSYSAIPEPPARAAVRVRAAALPSGRTATSYRHLADYGNEMKALAQGLNPDLVKHFTLPLASHLGRPVEGLEITTNPNALRREARLSAAGHAPRPGVAGGRAPARVGV